MSPQNYQHKRTGNMGKSLLPPGKIKINIVRNFSYDCSHKKSPVPKSNERPVHGLRSDKNFILTNAIETILSTAKKVPEEIDWKKKKEYGQNPEYL